MAERTSIPVGERIAGLILLAVLVGLVGFLVTRKSYYPAQVPVDVEADAGGGGVVAGAPSDPPGASLLPEKIPDTEWVREGDLEIYSEDRLYVKINGADERYRLYGTNQLVFAAYVPEPDSKDRLDVFSYEMRTPLAALGIFGRNRSPGVVIDKELGEAGYLIESMAFFRKGRYYVQVRGYAEEAREASEKLARYLAETIPAEPAAETAFAFFPQEGRIAGTERFEPKDRVLGTDFLENVFSAEYVSAEAGSTARPVILFVVNRRDEESAQRAVDQYKEHLGRQAKVLNVQEIEGVAATLMDLDGLFEGFWAEGELFAGVAEAPDQTTLRKYAAALVRALRAGVVPRLEATVVKPPLPTGG